MDPVRLRHEGAGVYRYGWAGRPVGRLRFLAEGGGRVEPLTPPPPAGPYPTAALGLREHWRAAGQLPELLEVPQPDPAPAPVPPRPVPPPPATTGDRVRQGRLRQVSGRAVSVAELARRSREPER